MKSYNWNIKKNEILKVERNISFEDIVYHIEKDGELDIFPHPNQEKYPNQMISVVAVNDYAYLVPYVEESEDIIFLKTIIPSRKATKKYIGE